MAAAVADGIAWEETDGDRIGLSFTSELLKPAARIEAGLKLVFCLMIGSYV